MFENITPEELFQIGRSLFSLFLSVIVYVMKHINSVQLHIQL